MRYRLSEKAVADLRNIARYTVEHFGVKQSDIYREGFKTCFETLCANPNIGRDTSHIRQGLRRFDHASHSIFYIIHDNHLLIVRILHSQQDALRHLK